MSVKLLRGRHVEDLVEELEGYEVVFVQILKTSVIVRVGSLVTGFAFPLTTTMSSR